MTVIRLYHVVVAPGIEYDCLGDVELKLKRDDEVIVRCERYRDYGTVAACDIDPKQAENNARRGSSRGAGGRKIEGRKTPEIIRRATLTDKGKAHEREVMAHSMQKTAVRKIKEHGLEMKLLNSHVSFDGRLAAFQFSAEGRIDFRELLRDLSGALHTRVELRQVGVRDEAAIQGGLGPCGRVFCCTSFLREFVSINVKMAKAQGLSLNPSNISGACGRLKCCLKFEDETYRELNRGMPRGGSFVDTPEGVGRVQDCNPLAQTVRVWLPEGGNDGGKVMEFGVGEVTERPRGEGYGDRCGCGAQGQGGERRPSRGRSGERGDRQRSDDAGSKRSSRERPGDADGSRNGQARQGEGGSRNRGGRRRRSGGRSGGGGSDGRQADSGRSSRNSDSGQGKQSTDTPREPGGEKPASS